MAINQGTFTGDVYLKRVSFNKAVLWKDKQISLNPKVVSTIRLRGTKKIVFEDLDKNQRWTISTVTFFNNAKKRTIGQESQYYIGIGLFEKTEIRPTPVAVGEPAKTVGDLSEKQGELF